MRDVLAKWAGGSVVGGDAGFDFCRREGVAFIVVGSFSKAGDTFVTEFKLLDPDTRKIVATAAARGTGEDSILNAHIDELSRRIAAGMGVAGQKLDSTRMAVAEVTTHSTEAYAVYLQGREQLERFDEPGARMSFERPSRSIEFASPTCASLRRRAGRRYAAIQAAYRQAKELDARPGEGRLLIEARYAWRVKGQPEVDRAAPDAGREISYGVEFHFESGRLYADPDAAIAEYQAARRSTSSTATPESMAFALVRNPTSPAQTALSAMWPWRRTVQSSRFARLAPVLAGLVRRRTTRQDGHGLEQPVRKGPIGYMTAMKEDYDGALAWLDRYMTNVYSDAARAEGPVWQGIINYLIGRRTAAFERLEAGLALARSSKSTFREGLIHVMRGFMRSDMEEKEQAREDLDLARRILEGVSISSQVAWRTGQLYMDIRWGDPAATDKVMAELDRIAPPENLAPWGAAMRRSFLILMYLGRGEEEAALREAALPRSYEIVNPNLNFNLMSLGANNMPLTADGIAQLLARRGQIDKAIEEYRLLMTTGPGTGLRRLINPIYHFRVADLYEKKGDKPKAIEHYKKFLEIWKNADPGLPEPGLAKARLAALEK
jgi:tetratricopeptide (TPR) repeat protein